MFELQKVAQRIASSTARLLGGTRDTPPHPPDLPRGREETVAAPDDEAGPWQTITRISNSLDAKLARLPPESAAELAYTRTVLMEWLCRQTEPEFWRAAATWSLQQVVDAARRANAGTPPGAVSPMRGAAAHHAPRGTSAELVTAAPVAVTVQAAGSAPPDPAFASAAALVAVIGGDTGTPMLDSVSERQLYDSADRRNPEHIIYRRIITDPDPNGAAPAPDPEKSAAALPEYVPKMAIAPTGKARLTIDAIPLGSPMRTVADLVDDRGLTRLREMCRVSFRGICSVCGGVTDQRPDIAANWIFDDRLHVQRLTGVTALCVLCVEVRTSGAGETRGPEEEATEHLAAINKWDEATTLAYIRAISKLRAWRGQHGWTLDLGLLADLDVTVRPGWTEARSN